MVLKGFNEETPLEEYKIKGRSVWVKRDDLMGDSVNLPPWGKIHAVYNLINEVVDKTRPLVILVIPNSYTALAISAICDELGIELHLCYSNSSKINMDELNSIKERFPKVTLNPIMPNVLMVMKGLTRMYSDTINGQTLPYAFEHELYKETFTQRIKPYSDKFDNLVVSSGAGVTMSGLVRGFMETELNEFWSQSKRQVWTTILSTELAISRIIKKNGFQNLNINLHVSEYDLQDTMDWYKTPFPCNAYWDKKQWYWLENNIDKLEGEILFWNIGG